MADGGAGRGGGATASGGALAKKALGCTNQCGDNTKTLSGERRTLRCPAGAATVTRDGGRRGGAATELRRGRLVDAAHGKPNKPHQEAPYLTTKLRSGTTETGRRRRRSSTTAQHGIGGGTGNLGFGGGGDTRIKGLAAVRVGL
jgi:hypothetical protein